MPGNAYYYLYMEKIIFAQGEGFAATLYTKEASAFPSFEPVEPYKPYSLETSHELATADEIPFVYYFPALKIYGAAKVTKDEALKEIPYFKMKDLMAQYGLKGEDVRIYLGPSLTFSHTLVERSVIVSLMEKGYRSACKRTSGVDFLDVPMLVVTMMRKLAIPFKNIHLDNHDTFECDSLLYSALRGDVKANPIILGKE
jgi:copper oxidase (laccase) domain-containing protein